MVTHRWLMGKDGIDLVLAGIQIYEKNNYNKNDFWSNLSFLLKFCLNSQCWNLQHMLSCTNFSSTYSPSYFSCFRYILYPVHFTNLPHGDMHEVSIRIRSQNHWTNFNEPLVFLRHALDRLVIHETNYRSSMPHTMRWLNWSFIMQHTLTHYAYTNKNWHFDPSPHKSPSQALSPTSFVPYFNYWSTSKALS